jgi:menaquinone-dependent protoporphyrinogen IX oxidase
MILGWHDEAVQFVETHQRDLSQKPMAYFLTTLSLTTSPETSLDTVPVYLDPSLTKPPKNGNKLSRTERFTTVAAYLEPALTKAPQVKPVSAGFFAGKLDYGRLNLFQKLFVRIIIRGEEGDFRDWNAIRAWAGEVHEALLGT